MADVGYTRVSSLGPIAAFLEEHGGNISRAFLRADIPVEILNHPDLPLRLSDHYRILKSAARELGDPYFGATLGKLARTEKLSAYGKWVTSAPTLGQAITRANNGLNQFMQTNTTLCLLPAGKSVLWTMIFFTPGHEGRFQNELLAVSYLIDTLRFFIGRDWTPKLIRVIGNAPHQASMLERSFKAPVIANQNITGVEFSPHLLTLKNPHHLNLDVSEPQEDDGTYQIMPKSSRNKEAVLAAIQMETFVGKPRIDSVANRLNLSRRTLQRQLERKQLIFSDLVAEMQKKRALHLLKTSNESISRISELVGYSDPSHFIRAFSRWTGTTPGNYRTQMNQNTELPF